MLGLATPVPLWPPIKSHALPFFLTGPHAQGRPTLCPKSLAKLQLVPAPAWEATLASEGHGEGGEGGQVTVCSPTWKVNTRESNPFSAGVGCLEDVMPEATASIVRPRGVAEGKTHIGQSRRWTGMHS